MSTAPHSRVALELPLCAALHLPYAEAGATLGALGAMVGAGGGSGVQQTVAVRQMTCEVAPPQRAPRSVRRATPPELRPAADLRLVS